MRRTKPSAQAESPDVTSGRIHSAVGRLHLLKKICLLTSLIIFVLFLFLPQISLAITQEECEEKIGKEELSLEDLRQCVEILEQRKQEAETQKRTFEGEIERFNTAIAVTTNKILITTKEIEELEKEITSLNVKIARLDLSLDQLSEILIKRVAETYKKGKIDPLALFLSSENFSGFVSRYKYLQVMQLHDRRLMIEMEATRTDYEDQKNLKEEKQEELESAKEKLEKEKAFLDQQRGDKKRLLEITQSNEKRYQQLLAITRAEIEAIQGIIAGRGDETEVGKIGQGARIASIILGTSACSTGTHLHFEIRENGEARNPLSHLKNISLVDDSGGDPHTASGSWEWPLNEPIKFNQGYGSDTQFIRTGAAWYSYHTGIDIASDDLVVKAAKPGTLYQGAIGCGGGTLRYVKVDHDDSNVDTYYLHVNY